MMVSFNFNIEMQLQNSLFTFDCYELCISQPTYTQHSNANSVSVHHAYLHNSYIYNQVIMLVYFVPSELKQ